MRRAIRGSVLAGLVLVCGLAGLGGSTAGAQGYGGYPGAGYGGYPAGGAYNQGYPIVPGNLNIGVGIGGYPGPQYGAYRPVYAGGYPHHHHHRHHRGCGHHGY